VICNRPSGRDDQFNGAFRAFELLVRFGKRLGETASAVGLARLHGGDALQRNRSAHPRQHALISRNSACATYGFCRKRALVESSSFTPGGMAPDVIIIPM
jgi:hypothetical protein